MLDRVGGEQFHQFIAPRSSLPLPPSLPPTLFDAYNNPSHHHLQLHQQQPNLLPPLHHKDGEDGQQQRGMSFEISEREVGGRLGIDSVTWTDDEVLALLRIRSDLDAWFPHLTWEHVSRKLAELGFKRSAEKCKEKFEEETSYFNNNIHYTKNSGGYRFMSELEQLYQQQQEEEATQMAGVVGQIEVEVQVVDVDQERKQAPEEPDHQDVQHLKKDHALQQHAPANDDVSLTKKCDEETTVVVVKARTTRGKRKREVEEDKFEILKGFCEKMVNKMMEKQEEMHKKLVEDMARRDQEIMERQEAWKKQEMEGMNWELELMAKEQAVAGQRQAAIIQMLNKISDQYYSTTNLLTTTSTAAHDASVNPPKSNCAAASSPSNNSSQNPNASSNNYYTGENNPIVNCASSDHNKHVQGEGGSSEVPNNNTCSEDCGVGSVVEGKTTREGSNNDGGGGRKEEVGPGRRWPREEVMALIKLRSSANEEREGGGGGGSSNSRVPLWERISEGMRGMGYSRSAKRCKEKWENINKYFRKTKHLSKKRSLDSRTCPYFPHLTSLYSQ